MDKKRLIRIIIGLLLVSSMTIWGYTDGASTRKDDETVIESSTETDESKEDEAESESGSDVSPESETEKIVTKSPAINCTEDLTVKGGVIEAVGHEAVRLKSPSTLTLIDTALSGSMTDKGDGIWNVAVYGSSSKDADSDAATLYMKGGMLGAERGGVFFTSNTSSRIYVSNVEIHNINDNDFFLKCTGSSDATGWGEAGKNGADCSFTADAQYMQGDIVYDSISNLDLYIMNGSCLKGAVLDDESNAGKGGDGCCNLYIDSISAWIVTSDCSLNSLQCEGRIVDENGRSVSIVGTDGEIYAEGESDYIINVTSYSEKADMSGAMSMDGIKEGSK